MNLYEINDAVKRAEEALFSSVDENGEINAEAFDAFQQIKEEREVVVESIALTIKNESAMAEMIRAEMDELAHRLKVHKNRVEWLKGYLVNALDGQKFETPKAKVGFRKSESIIIDNIDALPEQFLRSKTTIDADKTALKEALKLGESIQGAHIETKLNISIK